MRVLSSAVFAVFLALAAPVQAQTAGDVLRALTKSRPSTLSQQDASAGVKSALDLAARAATDRLGKANGFFGDARVRIPLPSALGRVQKSLQPMGMAGPLDDLQLSLNRAAEAAMPAAKQIVVDAVRGITLDDALTIVRGGDTAATTFLRGRTEKSLIGLLTPPMERALTQTGAYRAFDGVIQRNGLSQMMGVTRQDITNFAVQKALDGTFSYIAEEERSIRADPAKRTTDILRKVFGGR